MKTALMEEAPISLSYLLSCASQTEIREITWPSQRPLAMWIILNKNTRRTMIYLLVKIVMMGREDLEIGSHPVAITWNSEKQRCRHLWISSRANPINFGKLLTNITGFGDGEMTYKWRIFVALPQDAGPFPAPTPTWCSRASDVLFRPPQALNTCST